MVSGCFDSVGIGVSVGGGPLLEAALCHAATFGVRTICRKCLRLSVARQMAEKVGAAL
jgi:hypothetical protein